MPYPIPKKKSKVKGEILWIFLSPNDMMLETYGEVGMYIGPKT